MNFMWLSRLIFEILSTSRESGPRHDCGIHTYAENIYKSSVSTTQKEF